MELSSQKESLYKTITYRISVAIVTFIAFWYLGKLYQAIGITAVSQIVGAVWYYLHERLWANVGRESKLLGVKEIEYWEKARDSDTPDK